MRMIARFLILILILSMVLTGTVKAGQINTNNEGVAIKGYDTVAYFTMKGPTLGKRELQYEWMNAKWYFFNSDHLELLKRVLRYTPHNMVDTEHGQ